MRRDPYQKPFSKIEPIKEEDEMSQDKRKREYSFDSGADPSKQLSNPDPMKSGNGSQKAKLNSESELHHQDQYQAEQKDPTTPEKPDDEFEDDDSIDERLEEIILRDVPVRLIMTRQKTPEIEDDDHDLSGIIDIDVGQFQPGRNSKPMPSSARQNVSMPQQASQNANNRSGMTGNPTPQGGQSFRLGETTSKLGGKPRVEQISASCITRDKTKALLGGVFGSVFEVPLNQLMQAKTYSNYSVASVPLPGPVIEIADLGSHVALCSEGKLVILDRQGYSPVWEYELKSYESNTQTYKMNGDRISVGVYNGDLTIVWWANRSQYLVFSLASNAGWRLTLKENLNLRGKIRPGISKNSRCYSSVDVLKGYVILSFCDDQQIVFYKQLDLPLPVRGKSSFRVESHNPSNSQGDDVQTILMLSPQYNGEIWGLTVTPDGIAVLVRRSNETLLDLYKIKNGKANFYCSNSLDDSKMNKAGYGVSSNPRVPNKITVGNRVYINEKAFDGPKPGRNFHESDSQSDRKPYKTASASNLTGVGEKYIYYTENSRIVRMQYLKDNGTYTFSKSLPVEEAESIERLKAVDETVLYSLNNLIYCYVL